jgi:hypothetical protein
MGCAGKTWNSLGGYTYQTGVPFPARQTPNEYGASSQTESSWPDALSEAHTRYILSFMEVEQQKQEAILAAFLDQSEQH